MSRDNISHVVTLTHSKSGTTHFLVGELGESSLVECMFNPTSRFAYSDRITINDISYDPRLANGDSAPDGIFRYGYPIHAIVDQKQKVICFNKVGHGVGVLEYDEFNITSDCFCTLFEPNSYTIICPSYIATPVAGYLKYSSFKPKYRAFYNSSKGMLLVVDNYESDIIKKDQMPSIP